MKIQICVLGHSASGKTQLVKAICNEPYEEAYHSTTSIQNHSIEIFIKDSTTSFKFVEVAGQLNREERKKLNNVIEASSIFIISIDPNDNESIIIAQNWVKLLKPSNKPMIIVSTKCDLSADGNIIEEISQYAIQNNVTYFKCSSKHKINIDKLFKKMVELIPQQPKPTHPEEEKDTFTTRCILS